MARQDSAAEAGVSLRHLLISLGEPAVELQAAPKGLDVEVREVGILDLEDPAQDRAGELVLAVGARGCDALAALRAAGAARATAVALRTDAPAQVAVLGEAAAEAGVALLSVRRETRWERLDSLVRAVLGSGQPPAPDEHEAGGDLLSSGWTFPLNTAA
jgi:hypothetical protein